VTSSLTLVEHTRESADDGGTVSRSRRDYLDFVVDGKSLGAKLAPILADANLPAGYVPVLVLDWPIGFPPTTMTSRFGDRLSWLPSAATVR